MWFDFENLTTQISQFSIGNLDYWDFGNNYEKISILPSTVTCDGESCYQKSLYKKKICKPGKVWKYKLSIHEFDFSEGKLKLSNSKK